MHLQIEEHEQCKIQTAANIFKYEIHVSVIEKGLG